MTNWLILISNYFYLFSEKIPDPQFWNLCWAGVVHFWYSLHYFGFYNVRRACQNFKTLFDLIGIKRERGRLKSWDRQKIITRERGKERKKSENLKISLSSSLHWSNFILFCALFVQWRIFLSVHLKENNINLFSCSVFMYM